MNRFHRGLLAALTALALAAPLSADNAEDRAVKMVHKRCPTATFVR